MCFMMGDVGTYVLYRRRCWHICVTSLECSHMCHIIGGASTYGLYHNMARMCYIIGGDSTCVLPLECWHICVISKEVLAHMGYIILVLANVFYIIGGANSCVISYYGTYLLFHRRC